MRESNVKVKFKLIFQLCYLYIHGQQVVKSNIKAKVNLLS